MTKGILNTLDQESHWYDHLPISINNLYGDALTKNQIDDTVMKLNYLRNHKAPYSIITKGIVDSEIAAKLKGVAFGERFICLYSLTGLNEGGFSFADRVKTIEKLCKVLGSVTILVRPIIAGRNDSKRQMLRIVDVAKQNGGRLITGALHDKQGRKQVDLKTKETLVEICLKKGVKVFHKSSCASSNFFGMNCWMHDLSEPKNTRVMDQLGYDYEIQESTVVLDRATVGDLNFLRLVCNCNIMTKKLISRYNIPSISSRNHAFENTSSWYSWSRNAECSMRCPYCIISSLEYLDHPKVVGVEPDEIVRCSKPARSFDIKVFGLHNDGSEIDDNAKNDLSGYRNFRTIQECCSHKYPRG